MNIRTLMLLFFAVVINTIYANRGDVVNYEIMAEWTPREVLGNTYQLVDPMVASMGGDSATNAIITKFLKVYIARNNLGRALTFYKISYKTIDFDDQEAIATGLIIIPKRQNGTCSYGLSVYNHGTIFGKDEVPSLYFENRKFREGELFFAVIMASMEQITLVPDYYGMGAGTGIHHHNMDKTNSNSTIDMIRAARNLCTSLGIVYNSNLALTGYSEGGTVSMNTAKRIHEEGLQYEFPNVLVCPASGAYDLSTETFNFIMNNPYYPTRSYILYIACSCQDMYKNLYDVNDSNGIDKYLKPPYNELYRENLPTQTGNVGWVPLPWPQMFRDNIIDSVRNNESHPFRTCLQKNNCYDWANPYETFIHYCNTDDQVPPSGAIKAYNTQQSYIPPERYWDRYKIHIQELSFDGFFSDHFTCAIPSMFVHFENMRSRRNIKCIRNARLQSPEMAEDVDKTEAYEIALSITKNDDNIQVFDMDNTAYNIIKMPSNGYNIASLPEGFYMYKSSLQNEDTEWDYFIKTPYNFVNTDDYNPIQLSDKGEYFVDISRLNENVSRIDILDIKGNNISTIKAENIDKVTLVNKLPSADYIVMVITDKNKYPLKWKKENFDNYNVSKDFTSTVVNNNLTINVTNNVNIDNICISDMLGKKVYIESYCYGTTKNIDLSALSQGIYIVTINGTNSQKIFVK